MDDEVTPSFLGAHGPSVTSTDLPKGMWNRIDHDHLGDAAPNTMNLALPQVPVLQLIPATRAF